MISSLYCALLWNPFFSYCYCDCSDTNIILMHIKADATLSLKSFSSVIKEMVRKGNNGFFSNRI